MIKGKKQNRLMLLIAITWLTYFSTYLGRLNFSASMNEIGVDLQITKAQLGVIASAFFVAYGAGQLISGIMGDWMPPIVLVFTGVAGAAFWNLMFGFLKDPSVMTVIWFFNGIFQSLTWAPMAKWISDQVDHDTCSKIFLLLSTTGPAGMLCSYLLSALGIHYSGWRTVFILVGIIMGVISVLWAIVAKNLDGKISSPRETVQAASEKFNWANMPVILSSGILVIGLSACIHGILKDGINTWVPTYLAENFELSSVLSILMTMVMPIINLSGVYLADFWNRRIFRTEVKTAAVFFIVTAFAVVGMNLLGGTSAWITVLFFSVITTSMTSINTLLVSLVPVYFQKWHCVATVVGFVNSLTYLGTAMGSSLFGVIADHYGWTALRILWLIISILGAVVSLSVCQRWKKFRSQQVFKAL